MKMILNGASKFYQPVTLTEIKEEKNIASLIKQCRLNGNRTIGTTLMLTQYTIKYNLHKFKKQ